MGRILINRYSDGVTPLKDLTPSELAYVASAITSYSPQMISICVEKEFSTAFDVEIDSSRAIFFDKLNEDENSLLKHEFQEASNCNFLYKRPYEIDEESALEYVIRCLLSHKGNELRVIEDFLSEAFAQNPTLRQLRNTVGSVTPFGEGKPDFLFVFNQRQEVELSDLYVDNSQYFNSINHTILWWKSSWGNFDRPQDVNHDEQIRLKDWFAEAIKPEKRGLKTNFPLAEAIAKFCWEENRFPTSKARDQKLLWSYFKEAGTKYDGEIKIRGTEESFIYSPDSGDKKFKVEVTKKTAVKSYKDTYYKNMLRAFGLSLIPTF
ncbi:hypothetical protein [Alteromonas stellipolaris]|uniref:hypothetical protein n=1 Tax=Alteromonas stellipolaris TaxID=233316 RepID=UPI00273773DB|nr:hypothetical protein [Alteromonas stellipolaris]MDP2595143.1 hypothetical protein [Alteromonas stellipolaris]